MVKQKEKQTKYYNVGSHELPKLNDNQAVRLKPEKRHGSWIPAKVVKQVDVRSYAVRTEDGAMYRRNRRFLRTTKETDFMEFISPSSSTNDRQPIPLAYHNHNTPQMTAARLQRYTLTLMPLQYDIDFRDTSKHIDADAFSRFPLENEDCSETLELKKEICEILDVNILNIAETIPVNADKVKMHTNRDPVLPQIIKFLNVVFPKQKITDKSLTPFLNKQLELTVHIGCLL